MRAFGAQILVLIIEQQCVVSFGARPEIRPSPRAQIAGQIVIVRTEVGSPADTARVEHETSQIKVRVGIFIVSAFHAQVQSSWVVPRASHAGDINAAENRTERPGRLHLLRRFLHWGRTTREVVGVGMWLRSMACCSLQA